MKEGLTASSYRNVLNVIEQMGLNERKSVVLMDLNGDVKKATQKACLDHYLAEYYRRLKGPPPVDDERLSRISKKQLCRTFTPPLGKDQQ
ncbi:hypothetical protein TNCV_629741 [Trichonephila clavipes]|uniref:Uncharacterized protein n=1 Tax=Trichonephila clavipes TaxID=2585209 RepID=A0A8X6REL0_TRICX|nr:hypothetical protein TNCV_629741 [Trichonephila clavipes]